MPSLPESLQRVVNSLPKGSLHFSLPGYLSEAQKEKIAIALLQEILCLIFTLCLLFVCGEGGVCVGGGEKTRGCLQTVNVCSRSRIYRVGWGGGVRR